MIYCTVKNLKEKILCNKAIKIDGKYYYNICNIAKLNENRN